MPLLPPKVRLEDVVLDDCFDDIELRAVRDAVADTGRPVQERADRAIRLVLARRPDPERQLLAQEVLADAGHHLAPELARRATAPDLDPDDRADTLGLAAAAHVAAAWQVRGAGAADTVGADPAKASHTLLEIADDLALDGLRAVPDSPGCALARVVAGRGRGVPDDELLHRFEVARRRDPLAFAAHLQTLQAVCQKWFGSHDSMFDLVRQTLAVAPAGHPVTVVLPVAHLEYLAAGETDAMQRRRHDLPHVHTLSAALLAADDGHPRAMEAHSGFGWFFASVGEKATARAHLRRSWLRPSWIWTYLDDDARRTYVEVLKENGAAR